MTIASILAFAPTSEIAKRAELLATAIYFTRLTHQNDAYSGTIPDLSGSWYQVYCSLAHQRFLCTCNMRQQPCIHALALAILATKLPDCFSHIEVDNNIAVNNYPVYEQQTAASNQEQALHEKHQRRLQRLERAAAGFEDLDSWLDDVVRRGLGTIYQETPRFAEHIATRMADASLSGLARKLRLCEAQALTAEDWTLTVLTTLSELKAVSAIFRKRLLLSEGLFADLMDYCGINMRKEDILAEGVSIADDWLVVGWKEEILEDRLEMRRTWLWGLGSQRFAMLLDYGFGSGGLPPHFEFAHKMKADVVFYPSAIPLRILINAIKDGSSQLHTPDAALTNTAKRSWKEVQLLYAQHLAICPWHRASLIIVNDVKIKSNIEEDTFYLQDAESVAVVVKINHDTFMMLLSFTQGNTFTIVGEWNGQYLMPIAACYKDSFLHVM